MIRFYDKDYNLLWSGEELPRVMVMDEDGHRRSYHIEVTGVPMPEGLFAQRIPDNPTMQEHQQLHRYMGGGR